MNKQDFLTPFDDRLIKQRVGSGGKTFSYVAGGDIVGKAIQVTDNGYDWEVSRLEVIEPAGGKAYWLCVGYLSIPGLGRRTGVGSHQVMDMECPKSAETDAFKRAAMKFGIGLHLYCDVDEYGQPQVKMATEEQQERVARLRSKIGLPAVDTTVLTHQTYVAAMMELKAVETAIELHISRHKPEPIMVQTTKPVASNDPPFPEIETEETDPEVHVTTKPGPAPGRKKKELVSEPT